MLKVRICLNENVTWDGFNFSREINVVGATNDLKLYLIIILYFYTYIYFEIFQKIFIFIFDLVQT